MRVLIVGCGYVGLALGTDLAKQGHEVFGLRRSRAAANEMRALGIKPLLSDITLPNGLAKLPGDFDWVVNCVSSTGGGPSDYRAVYLEGARTLLAWLRKSGLKKLVYTSSTSVYGQTDASVVDETSRTDPMAETAKLLVETEQVFLQAAPEPRLPSTILRVGAIYGPGRGYWLKQFLKNEATIDGSGERYFNMIHRDDVVGAVIGALDKGRPGEIYNAVDDEPVSQAEYFRWLAATLGRPMPPHTVEGHAPDLKRGLTNKRVSNQKLKTELGYHFRYPTFREGCTAELHRANLLASTDGAS